MADKIYPPILESSQAAFKQGTDNYKIYFTVPNITSFNEVKHIQVRIVFQNSNTTAVGSSKFPDGIIYLPASASQKVDKFDAGQLYYVTIDSKLLKQVDGPVSEGYAAGWKVDTYYKVQLRFGKNELWEDSETFVDWISKQVQDENNFSEWSTVMQLKVISNDTKVEIANTGGKNIDDLEYYSYSEYSITPKITGYYETKSIDEPEDKYRFQLYDGDIIEPDHLIEDSGWLQHDAAKDNGLNKSIDTYVFKHVLSNLHKYTVIYSIKTVNKYEDSALPYIFFVQQTNLVALQGINLVVADEEEECCEEGITKVYLTSDYPLNGNFIIGRASEKTNYTIWEDIKYLTFFNRQFNNELIYEDFTIESGIRYKYGFQQINSNGNRTNLNFENGGYNIESAPERCVDFEYSYLYCNGIQLKLKYNNTMNSFKRTQLQSKQDTLGSKYPTIMKNGSADYAEFPINALISLHLDENQKFFKQTNAGYSYKDELVIPADKYTDIGSIQTYRREDNSISSYEGSEYNTFDTNLTSNNQFIERKFREKVNDFLQNEDYKLYKSPTEGNIIVTLTNVTMQPNQSLGRMIYSFTSTAYEVLDNTVDNMRDYGILDVGEYEEDIIEEGKEGTVLFGQLSGVWDAGTNFYDIIAQDNSYDIGSGYRYEMSKLKKFCIEPYPQVDYAQDIENLKGQLNETEDAEERESLSAEIDRLSKINEALQKRAENSPIVLTLGDKTFVVQPGKPYIFEDIENIKYISINVARPIIINYVCIVDVVELETATITSMISQKIWNQIVGVFDKDNLDILKAIELKTKDEVGKAQGNKNFVSYNEVTKMWDTADGLYSFGFDGITSLQIQAAPNTVLYIGHNGESDKKKVFIGETSIYTLHPIQDSINYLVFESPCWAIVNYQTASVYAERGVETNAV